jgi:hypothetical protein
MREDIRLRHSEKLLWSGKPERHPVFTYVDILLVPFSLLWAGFAVFWELDVIASDGPLFMRLWGIPFLLVGLYIVAGRFLVRVLRSRTTRYVVTNRRVIETVSWPRRRVTEAYLRDLPPPVMDHTDDGARGSVAFGSFPGFLQSVTDAMAYHDPRLGPRPIVLRDIPRPRRVYDLITEAQS